MTATNAAASIARPATRESPRDQPGEDDRAGVEERRERSSDQRIVVEVVERAAIAGMEGAVRDTGEPGQPMRHARQQVEREGAIREEVRVERR